MINKKIKAEDNNGVEITFNFKHGERMADFDDLVLEITGLVNDRRKQRLEQEKKKATDVE